MLNGAIDGDKAGDLRSQSPQCFFGSGKLEAHMRGGIVTGLCRNATKSAAAPFGQIDDPRNESRIVDRLVDRHAGTGVRPVITSSIEPPPGIIGQTFSAG